MAKRSASSAPGARTGRNAPRTSRKIDYSDIPALSSAELGGMRRVGRPPIGDEARQLIAIRLDPQVLAAFRKEAKRRGVGYQTLVHDVLAKYIARVA
jgi:uncharacterized protein (DUF4415 family)